ncbi:MAG: FAD-dependent oxidoreductase [Acidimicrobiia bacterium]
MGLGLSPEFTLERLKARAAEVQEAMGATVAENLERHRIQFVHGEASSLGPQREVLVTTGDGSRKELAADIVLIATGSRPWHAPGVPFDDPDVYDSETILGLDGIPESLVVIGAGPVGSEYASVFTALGVDVTLIDMADRLVPFLDAEVADVLRQVFEEGGMSVVLGTGGQVDRANGTLRVTLDNGDVLEPENVLFAAGRLGNTENLGLQEAGVDLDDRGRIIVDAHYQTSAAGIYAAGDVIGPPALGSVSAEQGRVAACHAFGIPFKETVDPLPPYGVYSIPEVGMVGLTEEAAAEAGLDYEVGKAWFADNARSWIAATRQGLVKLVLSREDRRLIGAHVVGEEASELIHQAQAIIHADGTIDQFINSTYNIPTRSEAFKYAAYDALQRLSGSRLR